MVQTVRKLTPDVIEHQLVRFVQDLVRLWMLEETASVIVERRDATGRSGTSATIVPRKGGCARVVLFAENGNDTIYATFGRGTVLEVPAEGGRYTSGVGAAELEALLDAVVHGRFRETVWARGSMILRSEGVLRLDGEVVRVVSRRLLPVAFWRRSKTVFRYAAYS